MPPSLISFSTLLLLHSPGSRGLLSWRSSPCPKRRAPTPASPMAQQVAQAVASSLCYHPFVQIAEDPLEACLYSSACRSASPRRRARPAPLQPRCGAQPPRLSVLSSLCGCAIHSATAHELLYSSMHVRRPARQRPPLGRPWLPRRCPPPPGTSSPVPPWSSLLISLVVVELAGRGDSSTTALTQRPRLPSGWPTNPARPRDPAPPASSFSLANLPPRVDWALYVASMTHDREFP